MTLAHPPRHALYRSVVDMVGHPAPRFRNKQKFLEDTDTRVFEKEKAIRSTFHATPSRFTPRAAGKESLSRAHTHDPR